MKDYIPLTANMEVGHRGETATFAALVALRQMVFSAHDCGSWTTGKAVRSGHKTNISPSRFTAGGRHPQQRHWCSKLPPSNARVIFLRDYY